MGRCLRRLGFEGLPCACAITAAGRMPGYLGKALDSTPLPLWCRAGREGPG
jgi:hypothetical protein